MTSTRFRRLLNVTLLVFAFAFTSVAQPIARVALRREDAQRFAQKIVVITEQGVRGSGRGRRTPVTESEVNAYLAYDARDQIPAGVVAPYISILGNGRLAGQATVDLDAVRQQRRTNGWLDPLTYLSGRLPVAATGVLRTANGVGQFTLETASIAGVTIPKALLQELVSYYSRSPHQPAGISLDDPFALPAHIREIQVGRGQAVVVQ